MKPFEILLVEDNHADVYMVREALRKSGLEFNLHVAPDGDCALTHFANAEAEASGDCPSLVMLDLNIPKVSGIEVLTQIRGGRCCTGVPVVIVTSSDSPNDLEAVRNLRVSAYFRKPTNLQAYMELGTIVQQVLRGEKPESLPEGV